MRSKIASALVALLLLTSVLAGAATPALAQSSGYVGVPDSNITEDLPAGSSVGLAPSDLEGSVMASDHADSLQVVITTPERASDYVSSSQVGSGDLALVFKDDSEHQGRTVAVPSDAIRQAVGHVPNVVYGVHEDGDEWSSQVRAENGLLYFEIPKFSSNSVTFSGTVEISAAPATDGSSFSYDLSGTDSVSDPVIDLTGVTNSETESASATLTDGDSLSLDVAGTTAASDASVTFNGRSSSSWHNVSGSDSPSGQFSPSIGGNLDPTGPGSNNKPVLEVTAHHGSTSSYNPIDTHGDGTNDQGWNIAGDDSNNAKTWIELRVQPDASGEVTELTVNIDRVYGNEYNPNVDVYMVHETPDTTQGEGTLVKENWNPSWTTGTQTVTLDTPYKIQSGQDYTIEFVTTNSDGDDTGDYLDIATDDSASSVWVMSDSLGGTTREDYADIGLKITQPVNDLSVGGDVSASFGDFADGETKTREVSLSPSSATIDFLGDDWGSIDYVLRMKERTATEDPSLSVDGSTASYSGILVAGESATRSLSNISVGSHTASATLTGGPVDATVQFTEQTETQNPAVDLNGVWSSYSGTLSDGETATLSGDKASLRDGTNQLNVSLDDGALSADAPPMQVDLQYSHDASTSVKTEYHSNGFAETYNVSNTFSSTQSNPTLEVPFSSTVYRLPQLEWSINDGSWSSVPDSRYSWSDNTLVVDLKDGDTDGDVDAGTKVEVRVEGRMVQVENGQISVPKPTDPDAAKIDSKIQVDSRSSGFHIVVGKSERLHYAYQESWETTADASVISSDGTQKLYLPNADAGDTAWITTAPMEVVPQTNDARVRLEDADGSKIKISGGPSAVGDDVAIRYYAVENGESYEAYSVSRERPVDKATAENGVAVFDVDDSEEVLKIQLAGSSDGGGSDSGGSSSIGSVGGNWPQPSPGTTLQEIAVVVAWAALVVLLVAATGRSELSGRPRWVLVSAVSLGTGLLSVEVLRPGIVSSAIGAGLQDVVPLAGLATIGIVGYSVVTWWQSRKKEAATPETTVDFNLGRFRR
ncbi:hypothetical protein [Halobellus inordinatus]|uniref:hypothetical protein n=1 Tax=Halobellus inordinatus TaxID=1126236 RepID=UPI00210CB46D|nr:hypothetical protein [Halobellus inordinatus]